MNILKYRYTLIFLIGFILLIIGIWLSFNKQPVLEGLANTSLVVLAGADETGNVYLANTGLATKPEWTSISGTLKQFTGSLGQIVGVKNDNTVLYGRFGNPYNWVTIPGNMTQVDFDYPMVTGISSTNGTVKYIDDITGNPETSLFINTTSTKEFKWINVSIGRGYGIGKDDNIWYASDIRKPEWKNVTNTLQGKTFVQVSYDGDDVAVLDSTSTVHYANSGLETTPNWITLNSPSLTVNIKKMTLKNRMIFAIGTDNNIYFSPSQIPNATWTVLTNTTTMTYIDCFYPHSANMITQRPATFTPCNPGFSLYNNQCFQVCPSGFTENGDMCQGIPTNRTTRPASVVPSPTFTCPSGFDTELSTNPACVSLSTNTNIPTLPLNEVYVVRTSGNIYTQVGAQSKCVSYGGTLATTNQVLNSQNAGSTASLNFWRSDNDNATTADTINCFGVKPPNGQMSDVLAFSTTSWNQATPCPFGSIVTFTARCTSTCPSGSTKDGGACIFPTLSIYDKPNVERVYDNYVCPTGSYIRGTDFESTLSASVASRNGVTCITRCPDTSFSDGTPYYTDEGGSFFRCIGATKEKASLGGVCPDGTGESFANKNICQVPNILVTPTYPNPNATYRNVTPVNFIPPCPNNYRLLGTRCYQTCNSIQTGYSDIGNGQCARPNVIRTSATPRRVEMPPRTLCSSNEDLIGTNCVTKCAANLISTDSTCTVKPVPRTGAYNVTSSCNSNETLLNGMCTTNCPDGTYPDGELCVSVKKKITPPTTIGCTSSRFGTVTKWFCESETAAASLVKDPSTTTSYVEIKDEVCVTDDPTTKMYFCQSVADIKKNTGFGDKLRSDYDSTCDNVKKNYFDLSNNITSLLLIKSGMTTGKDQLAAARTALNNIYTSLICDRPSSPQVSAMCTQIQNGATAIGSDSTDIATVLTAITPSIEAALNSRDSLLASISNFQCSLK